MQLHRPSTCRRCGREGNTTATCKKCNWCVRCKQEGHLVAKCAKAQQCKVCGQKDHVTMYCPEAKVLAPTKKSRTTSFEPRIGPSAAFLADTSEGRMESSRLPSHTSDRRSTSSSLCRNYPKKVLNIKVHCPKHDAQEWLALGPLGSQVRHVAGIQFWRFRSPLTQYNF